MKIGTTDSAEEAVVVVAPVGRDAELAVAALTESGVAAERCRDMDELITRLREPCGGLLLAEEALSPASISRLLEMLRNQPAWSDLPIILLTSGGIVTQHSQRAIDSLRPHGNVTLLERPIRVITLLSTIQVALRGRRRQYEVRDLLRQRDEVLASIHDSFAIVDRSWRYTYVNEHTCQLCQRSMEEMLGRTIWELFPQLVGSPFEVHMRRAMQERATLQFEHHNTVWGRWFEVRLYPTEGGLSLLTSEITARKQMELTLEESERRLHLALDTSKLGMWYCDLPFDKIIWDANCKRHFGLPEDAQVDFPLFYSLLHPEDRARTRAAIGRAVAEHVSYDVEYRAVRPDGSVRWLHAIGRAFYDDDGAPYRFDGITFDISEQKETELQLERAREEALEANRAKDHFLATLSHELRTPLTPVLMAVAALQQDPALPVAVRADLEMVQRNVELEARLIDDLLDLTRVTRGKLILHREVTDLHQLLERALETSRSGEIARKRLRVSFVAEAAEHHTLGDPARLQQILWNLLNNAVKFTPEGGTVELHTRNPEPGQIEICVADSGIGIEADVMPRLFDAFEQANTAITRRFGGLGLGLAISRTLAELHGGTLHATSDGVGRGATFVVHLQTTPAPKVDPSAKATPDPTVAIPPLRILLAEDHEPTRAALQRLLTRSGHQVRAAGTVEGALELAAEGSFDLLVSDLGLPDASGLDLMSELRARYQLPGIALSGYGMEEDVKASAAAGFAAHLTKPIDWRRFEETLRSLIRPEGALASILEAAGPR